MKTPFHDDQISPYEHITHHPHHKEGPLGEEFMGLHVHSLRIFHVHVSAGAPCSCFLHHAPAARAQKWFSCSRKPGSMACRRFVGFPLQKKLTPNKTKTAVWQAICKPPILQGQICRALQGVHQPPCWLYTTYRYDIIYYHSVRYYK